MKARKTVSRVSIVFVLCAALTVAAAGPEPVRYDGHKLVYVRLMSQQDIATMLEISQDHWSDTVDTGVVPFRVAPENMEALEASGLKFEIRHENIQELIDRQRAARPAEPAGWFDDFKTYAEINAYIDTLVSARLDLVTKLNLGQSLEGRTIFGMRISSKPVGSDSPGVLFNGTQHAREWITPMVNMYIADRLVQTYDADPDVRELVDDLVFFIVPIVNPDGYVYSWDVERLWRKNRRDNGNGCFGIDNNRNWGFNWGDDASSSSNPCSLGYRGVAPFSEPENQVVRNFILANPRILAHIDFHSYSQVVLSPYGEVSGQPPEPDRSVFTTLNALIASAIYGTHGVTYAAYPSGSYLSGGFACWMHADRGILAWTIELRDKGTYGFLLPANQIIPTCEENYQGIKVLAEYVRHPLAFVFPDGLPNRLVPDTSAVVSLYVKELGEELDLSSPVLLTSVDGEGGFTPSSLSPQGGTAYQTTLPALLCGSSLQYFFQAESAGGSVVTSPEGAPATVYATYAVNEVTVFYDTMESDTGWTPGTVGDGATTGIWVRVDPNGTAAQPEDDHTPTGTVCWVTGQGTPGGELGENDVDEGKTTLVSPVLDLGEADGIISYSRWYSNDTGQSPNEDIFLVDVSNDGGASWENVETVGPAGPETSGGWYYHEFMVSDFVEPTADVQVRFVASDYGAGSVVEAAVDDFGVRWLGCGPRPLTFRAAGCRYLRVRPPDQSTQVAMRLESPDYPCLLKYVGSAGMLLDAPVLQPPDQWGSVLIRGAEITPSTTYWLQPEDEYGADIGGYGVATTERWGDVAGESISGWWSAPDGNVDFQDITATVDRFKSLPGAPPLERCDLVPEVPDRVVSFTDIATSVDAFRGLPYPYEGPCP
jgi:murein tripeptide amidase MpaA